MKLIAGAIVISSVWIVSAIADTSYQPPQTGPGPYPASGVPANAANKPAAPPAKFTLLAARQSVQTPAPRRVGYPTPTGSTYSVTEVEYGTPEPVTSPRPEPLAENVNELGVNAVIPDSGTYYVLLPDGRLQKVSYSTMPFQETVGRLQDVENKALNGYQANVRYQDVEPIRGPIYAYNPAPLVRIFK